MVAILFRPQFVNDKSALVQVMARCKTGCKPLSEPMIHSISIYKFIKAIMFRSSFAYLTNLINSIPCLWFINLSLWNSSGLWRMKYFFYRSQQSVCLTKTKTAEDLATLGFWAPSQYPKRRLFVRSGKVSKPRDWYFILSYRFEIWQAHRQHCCRSACQISELSDNSKYKSRGFESLRDLTERRLFGYWDGALALRSSWPKPICPPGNVRTTRIWC